MAAIIPVIAGFAVEAGISAAIGTALTTTIAGFSINFGAIIASAAGSLAQSALGSAFGGNKKSGGGGGGGTTLPLIEAASQKTPQRNTVGFREIVYGKVKKSGTVVFEKLTSSGLDNSDEVQKGRNAYLNQVVVFTGHEIQSFENIYIDDVLLEIDSEGWVQNTQFTRNTDTFTPKAATLLDVAYTTADSATGSGTSASIYLDYAYATATNTIKVGDLIAVSGFAHSPYNGQFVVTSIASHAAGAATRVNYTTDSTITTSPITQVGASFQINAIGYRGLTAYVYDDTGHGLNVGDGVWIYEASPDEFNVDRTDVLTTPSTNTFTYALEADPGSASVSGTFQRRNGTDTALVNIQTFLGSDSQSIGNDGNISVLMADQLQTSDDFKGMAAIYARYFDADEFTSTPNLSAVIKGKKVYDYRSGGYYWSDNLALCIFDYMTWRNQSNNLEIGLGLDYDNDDQTSEDMEIPVWEIAADLSDEEIDIGDSETQRRYTMNGTLSMGEQVLDNVSKMLINGAGVVTWLAGKYRLHLAEYDIPLHHVDEDWLSGQIAITINNDKQELANTVTGVFLNEDELYYPDDAPQFQDAAALEEDNNEALYTDAQYPYVTNSVYAQRMNKLYLNLRRQKMGVEVPANYKGMRLAIWDTVYFTHRALNWQNKVFRVVGFQGSLTGGGVKAILKTEDSSIYDWSASEAV